MTTINLPVPGQLNWGEPLNVALETLAGALTDIEEQGVGSFILLDPLDPLPSAGSIPAGTLVLRRLADEA